MSNATPQTSLDREAGYESRDAPPRRVALAILSLFGLIGFAAVGAAGLFAILARERASPPATAIERIALVPPAPRLETDPAADRAVLEAAARQRISGLGWSDRGAGLAHIPIDRAMALLAGQGWPDAAEASPPGRTP